MGSDCYTSWSQASDAPSTLPIRASLVPVDPQAGVHRHVYERLLKAAEKTDRTAIDARLVSRFQDANEAAFGRWVSNDGRCFGIPKMSTRQPPLIGSLDSLRNEPAAIQHVFQSLPYPELAAQSCTREQVLRWGELEAYRHQIQTIEWIANGGDNEDVTRQFCGDPIYMQSVLRADDVTTCLLSQNVIGLGASHTDRTAWLSSFKRRHENGHFDNVLLQETHIPAQLSSPTAKEHAHQWGFRVGEGCPQLSFWSGDSTTTAGVGILVHPRGRFQNLQPAFQDHWTPHFMVGNATLDGEEVMSPTFMHLRRSALTALNHSSPVLEEMLNKWQLSHSLASVLPKPSDSDHVRWFHAEHHTHSYPVPGHGLASSRLDRWYTNDTARP
ncbi:unnamed protein product [Phytophthora fragariaefolia]|uniref:Unnamed protein product n=1 Tax=Phytophthora fragariaefolia TaxID=1490495 RepID=A0A9W6XHE8_9STRA|nr:unnamed protein product [Phytophthora fragariaefolia]